MMYESAGDRLTQGRANTHGGGDGTERQVEAPGSFGQIGDNQDGDNPENAGAHSIENLDGEQ